MSQNEGWRGSSDERSPGSPVHTLSEAANGELHLFVRFETLAADGRGDGGDAVDAGVVVPDAGEGPGSEPTATAARDEAAGAGGSADRGAMADCEPFVDTVVRPGGSSGGYADSAFGEAVDVESLVSYLGLDFVEHRLFADRFRLDADVVYTSRGVGSYQLLCVYLAGSGLLLVVDDDEAIRPLVGHARRLLER